MKIKGQTDAQLLDLGYYWKVGSAHVQGVDISPCAVPIPDAPTEFHSLVITPKFWLPQWLYVWLFRCLKAEWKVITAAQPRYTVWLADGSAPAEAAQSDK